MIRGRGYTGGIAQLRRLVRRLRPRSTEVYVRVQVFSGEQGQVDRGHFGLVRIGRATRRLSCFVLTLSYSRALYLEFFFDQSLENFIMGHVRALHELGGCPRVLLYDNLKAAVVERLADRVRFNAKLLKLSAHYHFQPQACTPGRPNEKGRVERSIRFIREGFFEARPFTNLEDFNEKALLWRDTVLYRPHPELKPQRVLDVFDLRRKPSFCPCPSIDSKPSFSGPSTAEKVSISDSTSMITPFLIPRRIKTSSWPPRTLGSVSWRARRSSPRTNEATTVEKSSKTPLTKRLC